jgi:hypothetical protein
VTLVKGTTPPANHRRYDTERKLDVVRVNCENPIREIWHILSDDENEYKVRKNLRSYYEEIHATYTDEDIERNASYFSYCIKQGKEYFTTAPQVSLLTRPLIIFYGMVSLAKAIVVLNNPKYVLQLKDRHSRSRQHGLGYLDNESAHSFIENDEVILFEDGIFPTIFQVFYRDVPFHRKYTLKEIYGWIPELYHPYIMMRNDIDFKPIFVRSGLVRRNNGLSAEVKVSKMGRYTRENLFDVLCHFKNAFTIVAEDGKKIVLDGLFRRDEGNYQEVKGEIERFLSRYIRFDIYNQEYLLPQSDRYPLNCLIALYMILYLYSRACRYQPQKWGKILLGLETEEKWFIEKTLDLALRKFPNEVINYFSEKQVLFRVA